MENIIKVLHLEDSLKDFELIHSIIEGGDIAHEYFLADNEKDFINILKTEKIDIILSDYHLPDYNGNEALKLVREKYFYIPFLFVTGTMGEDAAIESMLNGATDYVLKERLDRLVPAIKRALHENELEINRKRTEENFLRSISESPLGIRIISIEGETIFVNKAFLDIYECNSLEEFRSIPSINRYTPESYAQHQIRKEKIKNGHDVFDYELSIIRRNAEVRYIKVWRKEVLWDGVKHYQTFNLDITEQKRAEEEKNKQKEILQRVFDYIPVMITYFNKTGNIEMVNRELIEKLGWTFEEWKTDNIFAKCYPDPETFKEVLDFMINKPIGWKDTMITTKYGTVINTTWTNISLPDGISIGIGQDITERKQAEQQLEFQYTLLKALINSPSDIFIFSLDKNYCYTTFNDTHREEMKRVWNADIKIGMNLLECMQVTELKELAKRSIDRAFNGEAFSEIQHQSQIQNRPQTDIYYEFNWNPIYQNNEIIGVTSFTRDITEHKQAELELILANKELIYQNEEKEKRAAELIIANKAFLQSEENFHRSISESPLGIRIVSVNGETVYANKAFLDIYEINSLEEFTSTPSKNRYTPESYIQHQERQKKRKDGVEVFEYEKSINCKNGDIRHVKVSRKEILWNGSKHYQVINMDITEQRKAEESLLKLSHAVEQSPVSIVITDSNGNIEYGNLKVAEITGYTLDKLIGKNPRIFKSGEKSKSEYKMLWDTISSGKEWFGEFHNKKKNGELYWERASISPILNEKGEITHYVAVKEDITERKLTEEALNISQQELRNFATHIQNVREEEKLSLSREIHDDLAQISVALKIDLGLFERKLSKGIEAITSEELLSKLNDFSVQVDNSIKSARRIINGLRPELIELLGFEAACKSYLHDFEEMHHINSQFESKILNLNIDLEPSVALFRILQEALNNIIKHAKATLVTVQLSNPAGKLEMAIVDNGVGFDENNKGRQDSYGMIGMKERVFLLEGSLDISSKVGEGTRVRVEIPYSS